MLSIPRSLIRQLRLAFQRALHGTSSNAMPEIDFLSSAEGLTIGIRGPEVAVRYVLPETALETPFTIPFRNLKECEGTKAEPVNFEVSPESICLQWQDAGFPQSAQVQRVAPSRVYPLLPQRWSANEPKLLPALQAAMQTTEENGARYALHCLQLDGSQGSIAATNTRELFVQQGFVFPWQEPILLPTNRLFRGRTLPSDAPLEVGLVDDWFACRTGPWTIQQRIVKEGRFPKIDSLLAAASSAETCLELESSDRAFLVQGLPRLPGQQEDCRPVTLDLNGHIALRGQDSNHPAGTELVLSNSQYQGPELCCATNREYLLRAAELGLTEIRIHRENSQVLAQDATRSYVWMLLEGGETIASQTGMQRIASPQHQDHPKPISNPNEEQSMATPAVSSSESDLEENLSLLEQAEQLKATLQEGLTQTRALIAALKKQKKQNRLVQSTLASLRELGHVEV